MVRFHNDWLLLPERIALHEPSRTAVLADAHLGYGAARQRLGDAIPLRSIDEEMQPLEIAARLHDIQYLLVAGDLFERGFDENQHRDFVAVLEKLHIHFLGLVPGNHDRGVEKHADVLPLFPGGFDLAGWHICHGDQLPAPLAPSGRGVGGEGWIGTIIGHWHPAVRVKGRKQACFLTRGMHLILPAFSLDAAGVDVRKDVRWSDWQSHHVGDMHDEPRPSGSETSASHAP